MFLGSSLDGFRAFRVRAYGVLGCLKGGLELRVLYKRFGVFKRFWVSKGSRFRE